MLEVRLDVCCLLKSDQKKDKHKRRVKKNKKKTRRSIIIRNPSLLCAGEEGTLHFRVHFALLIRPQQMHHGTVWMDCQASEGERKKIFPYHQRNSTVTVHIVVHFLCSAYDCQKTTRPLLLTHAEKSLRSLFHFIFFSHTHPHKHSHTQIHTAKHMWIIRKCMLESLTCV